MASDRRRERVEKAVLRALSQLIRTEISDPRVQSVTLTQVSMSKDLRHAKIGFSVMGPEKVQKSSYYGLKNATRYLQRLVGDQVQLRNTPELKFFYDDSIAESSRLGALIARASAEIREREEKMKRDGDGEIANGIRTDQDDSNEDPDKAAGEEE